MRRFMTVLGIALLGYALLPTAAQAQVIYVQPARVYAPPVVVLSPPPVYYAAPPVTTYSSSVTYSYYPRTTTVVSSSPAPIIVNSSSAPATLVVPATGVITTRTSYGYGILRPRGYYTESFYTPLP